MYSGDVGTKEPCYSLTLVDRGWRLKGPRTSVPQAFDKIDDALAFASTDSCGSPAIVEIRAEGAYMVKRILPHR